MQNSLVIVLHLSVELKLPPMYCFQVYIMRDAGLAELCIEAIHWLFSFGRDFKICHFAHILSILYRILDRDSKK